MSTTTRDVLLSDRIDELIRGGRSAGMITMMTWAGKALELEAERTKLLDLIRQGVEAAKDVQATEGYEREGADPTSCQGVVAAYLSKVKEQLPNL